MIGSICSHRPPARPQQVGADWEQAGDLFPNANVVSSLCGEISLGARCSSHHLWHRTLCRYGSWMGRPRLALAAGSVVLVTLCVLGAVVPAVMRPQPPWTDVVTQQRSWTRTEDWLFGIAAALLVAGWLLLAYYSSSFAARRVAAASLSCQAVMAALRLLPSQQRRTADTTSPSRLTRTSSRSSADRTVPYAPLRGLPVRREAAC